MRPELLRKTNVFKAKYSQNSVMHLIIFCAVAFVLLQGVSVVLIILSSEPKTVFSGSVLPNIGLSGAAGFWLKPWTLFSYFWIHASFLELLSNMLWLYCFASVLQTFIGHKEIIPMFIFCSIGAGLVYLGLSFFIPESDPVFMLTAMPGVMAFAIGAFSLFPSHRYYLGEYFSVPIWLVLVIFLVLNVATVSNRLPYLVLLGSAGVMGFLYTRLLKGGYRPGHFFYREKQKIEAVVTPFDNFNLQRKKSRRQQELKISRHQVIENPSPEYVDRLLDKVSSKGLNSLTPEERQTLNNAAQKD